MTNLYMYILDIYHGICIFELIDPVKNWDLFVLLCTFVSYGTLLLIFLLQIPVDRGYVKAIKIFILDVLFDCTWPKNVETAAEVGIKGVHFKNVDLLRKELSLLGIDISTDEDQ